MSWGTIKLCSMFPLNKRCAASNTGFQPFKLSAFPDLGMRVEDKIVNLYLYRNASNNVIGKINDSELNCYENAGYPATLTGYRPVPDNQKFVPVTG